MRGASKRITSARVDYFNVYSEDMLDIAKIAHASRTSQDSRKISLNSISSPTSSSRKGNPLNINESRTGRPSRLSALSNSTDSLEYNNSSSLNNGAFRSPRMSEGDMEMLAPELRLQAIETTEKNSIKLSSTLFSKTAPSSSSASASHAIPSLTKEEISIGYVHQPRMGGPLKKVATHGRFSRGKLQERWFFIDISIPEHENYQLQYSYGEGDEVVRQTFPLEGATVLPLSAISGGRAFQLVLSDGKYLVLEAHNWLLRDKWVSVLLRAITVAKQRAKYLNQLST